MILKLLRRLPITDNYNEVLVYNEDREITQFVNYDKEMVEQVFGDELKVYWIGEIDEKRQGIRLVEQVEEQAW